MANRRYDVCSPRPKKDGGTHWHRCGTAWEGERGIQIIFDSLPLPDADGRVAVNLFEPRQDNARSVSNDRADARERSGGSRWGDDSEVPF